MDEVVFRRYLEFPLLVEGGRIVANWMPDGSSLWYSQGSPNERQILSFDPVGGTTSPLFDVVRLRRALHDALGYEPAGSGVPFEHLQFVEARRVAFCLEGNSYELDLVSYVLVRHPPLSTYSYGDLVLSEAEREAPGTFSRLRFYGTARREMTPESCSPDRRWRVGIADDNLVLRAAVDGHFVKITDDSTPEIFWDVETVLWNPWSPDSRHLVAFRQHTEGMARVPVIEWLKPRERVREVIAPPAGGALYRSELFLLDVYSQELTIADLGDTTNEYLRVLCWLPNGSELVCARYSRVFDRVAIEAINSRTGTVRSVLTEKSATFLATHFKTIWGTDTGFFLIPDGSGFIWSSERSGWNHLYHYSMEGELIRQLTHGDWRVQKVLHIHQDEGWVYFTGHGDKTRPYDSHFYRVRLNGEGLLQLTEERGQHSISLSPSAKYFADTYSSVDVPPKTVLRETDGTAVKLLGEADASKLQSVGWVAPQEHVVKAADGVTDLWVTIYLPYRFNPNEKYPVIEHIYAGPQIVARSLDFDNLREGAVLSRQLNFVRALANLGFVVVTLDGRGTPGRSKSFQDVIHKNWGKFEIADHAGAIQQLGERLGFLDLKRVGVFGASWGGQYAFRAMVQAPQIYRAGISEVPSFDPRRLALYEPFLGMPQDNPICYEGADTFSLAPRLEGELLLIGSMSDPATQADLFKMSEILIRLGKQHRTMNYPYAGHTVVGRTAEYDIELKKRFFLEHLKKAGVRQ